LSEYIQSLPPCQPSRTLHRQPSLFLFLFFFLFPFLFLSAVRSSCAFTDFAGMCIILQERVSFGRQVYHFAGLCIVWLIAGMCIVWLIRYGRLAPFPFPRTCRGVSFCRNVYCLAHSCVCRNVYCLAHSCVCLCIYTRACVFLHAVLYVCMHVPVHACACACWFVRDACVGGVQMARKGSETNSMGTLRTK